MNEYFLLNENAMLVKGNKKNAVYDFLKKDIFALNELDSKILENCESYFKVSEVACRLKIDRDVIAGLLKEIKLNGLGDFYSRPVFIDKQQKMADPGIERMDKRIKLSTVSIELHNKCSLNCLFCKKNSKSFERYNYCGCHKNMAAPLLNLVKLEETLKQIAVFAPHSIRIIGGDPLYDPLLFNKSCELIGRYFPKIIVNTNLNTLDNNSLELLRKLNITVEVPMFSLKAREYDKITQVDGGYNNVIKSISLLKEKSIELKIILFIMPSNVVEIERLADFCSKFGLKSETRFIYPAKIKNGERDFIRFYNQSKMNFPGINRNQFDLYRKYHYCLNGRIAVDSSGNIKPCHNAKNHILGNVYTDRLSDIIKSGSLDMYWELCNDKFPACSECEFRYSCRNCPFIEREITGSIYQKNKYCVYCPGKEEK